MKQVEKCCNMCGKKRFEEAGIPREEFVVIEKQWGYFSGKDGEVHTICLCEQCYDQWIKTLKLPPKVLEMTELV